MQTVSLKQLAEIAQGELYAPEHLKHTNITTLISDSRTFFEIQNTAFIAIVGPTNNGHNFIASLIEKGVRTFIVSDKNIITQEAAFVLVENTQLALQKIAAHNRQQFSYPVIGITGSNGKTIVKEWLHDIFSEDLKIVRSPKSYNSQIGVPLSVLLMKANYELAIFEAGISQVSEMDKLAEVIAPDIGILTNIGDAHQENFKTLTEKLEEKLKLFSESKNLIFRCDDSRFANTIKTFCGKSKIRSISWSLQNNNAEIQFSIKQKKGSSEISTTINHTHYSFKIPFNDVSAIENACHCFCALVALKLPPAQFLKKFEQLQAVAMRLEIKQGINNCLLINDYYNSDLNALGIALSVLKQQVTKKQHSKLVILSDIKQSGIANTELYKKVDALLIQSGIDKVIGIGPDIYSQRNTFKTSGEFYANRTDFEERFYPHEFTNAVILIKGARQFHFEKISGMLQQKAHQTVLEINLNAIIHNLTAFRKLLAPTTKIMVMVKAFSYGSGDVEIARLLQHQNIDYLAVAVADEGVALRKAGITTPIVVMNPEQDSFQNMLNYHLEPNIYSFQLLQKFARSLAENGQQNYPIHLKIDTGMNRLGLKHKKEIEAVVDFIKQNELLKIQSVFSHLAASDEPTMDTFTQDQFRKFEENFALIASQFDYKIEKHLLNSAGIERFPHKQLDMVRLGIGLYGISQTGMILENVGTFRSTVSQLKTVTTDETIGYSRKGQVKKTSKIAIVPLGYADGLDRKLGNGNGNAFINDCFAPIIGNICMDMLMLDVSEVEVKVGDSVEFFGSNISITKLADKLGTIPYEVLTGISQRVKRIYTQE